MRAMERVIYGRSADESPDELAKGLRGGLVDLCRSHAVKLNWCIGLVGLKLALDYSPAGKLLLKFWTLIAL